MGSPNIFKGKSSFLLTDNLEFKDGKKLKGNNATDPNVTAEDGLAGSVKFVSGGPDIYIKQKDGNNTKWKNLEENPTNIFHQKADWSDTDDFTTGNSAIFDGGGGFQGTFTRDATPAKLFGGVSVFSWVGSATAALNNDDYIATEVIPISPALRGKPIGITFYYRWTGDTPLFFRVHDDTNSKDLDEGTLFLPNFNLGDGKAKKFDATVLIPENCEEIKLGFQVDVGEVSKELNFDNFAIFTEPLHITKFQEENDFWAEIAGSTATVTNERGGAVASVTRVAAGVYDVNLTSGFFANVPYVSLTSRFNNRDINTDGETNTTIRVLTFDNTNTTVDTNFYIGLSNKGSDYKEYADQVISSRTGTENSFYGYVTGSAGVGVALTEENVQDWCTVSRTSAGVFVIDYSSLNLSTRPMVRATVVKSSTNAATATVDRTATYDATQCTILIDDASDTNIDEDFNVVIQTTGVDYKNPTHYAITPFVQTALLQDQKASGTAGGTFTSGARRTRDLNTIVKGSFVTLLNNQFTIPEGIYYIEIDAPAALVNRHRCWLRNVTDSKDEFSGNSMLAANGTSVQNSSTGKGFVSISQTKTFEVQHQCTTTIATEGFGFQTTFGDNEVYTIVSIMKLR